MGGRRFAGEIIVLRVRGRRRCSLSRRDLEEMMAERKLSAGHTAIWRWLQCYAPIERLWCKRPGSWGTMVKCYDLSRSRHCSKEGIPTGRSGMDQVYTTLSREAKSEIPAQVFQSPG